jgi:hypothetical protein
MPSCTLAFAQDRRIQILATSKGVNHDKAIGDSFRRSLRARRRTTSGHISKCTNVRGQRKTADYSYVGNWDIPRAQWGEMAKADAADEKILDKAIASGTIVGYGHDVNLVHQTDGATHDEWWSAMSMAGVINMLEQFYQSGTTTSPVLESATKHWDTIYVSRYYNWHPGSWKNGYTYVASYKLTKDAPDDAVEMLSKNLIVPLWKNSSLTVRFMSTRSTLRRFIPKRRGRS